MVRSRVFIFLAVTLCFVACLCAQATVNEAEAIKAVHDAEQSIVKAMKMAEYELKEAEKVKRDMEWYESKAEKRVSEANATAQVAAAAAAEALVAANNNSQDNAVLDARQKRNAAQDFAINQKNELQNARDAYPNVKTDTNTAIQSLTNVILKVRKLDQKEEIEVLFNADSPIDYTKVRESALSIKRQAEALEEEIENATKLLGGAKVIIYRMPAPTTEELVEKYKADGIVAGSVFHTIVGETDSIVNNIKFQKNQVTQSVETMKNIFKMNPGKLSTHINGFLATAQGDLVTISQMVIEAHKAQKNIMQWKKHAEGSNKTLNGAKDETTARIQLLFIKHYAESSASALERMKETLKSTGQSVRSAQNQLQSAADELLNNGGTLIGKVTATTQKPQRIVKHKARIPPKKENKGKTQQKTEEPAERATEISTSQKEERQAHHNKEKPMEETTVNPTNKDAVQLTDQKKQEPAEGKTTSPTSKTIKMPTDNQPDQLPEKQITKPTSKAAEGQTVNKPEQSAEGDTENSQKDANIKSTMINPEKEITGTFQNSAHQASDQPDMEKTVQSKDKKSEVLNLDTLRKGKKNITNFPFFGENVPASGAWSDGSLIVSVPLLVALIAFAVLH